MERGLKKTQIRFRMVNSGPLSQPPAPASRPNYDRGRYGQNRSLPSSGGAMAVKGRTTLVRNPRHPKNLYDSEMSMRRQVKTLGQPVKLTPGLSFPDPKSRSGRLLTNPKAPVFCFKFDPTAEDYAVVRNPLVDSASSEEKWTITRNINTADYASSDGSDDDSLSYDEDDDDSDDEEVDGADTQAPYTTVQLDETNEEVERAERQREELSQYARVTKLRAHRVMDSQLADPGAPPPPFEPQPPPPRAPLQPVLVYPRSMVREEESTQLRQSLRARNETAADSSPTTPPVAVDNQNAYGANHN